VSLCVKAKVSFVNVANFCEPFQKPSFLADPGKARFPLPQTPFKTKVVVEGFWNDHWLLAED
jgi:hypothetical protein